MGLDPEGSGEQQRPWAEEGGAGPGGSRAPSGGCGGETRLRRRAGAGARREMRALGLRSGMPDMLKVRPDKVS